jgi:hypothetical protein
VVRDRNARLGEPRPDRIEVGIARAAPVHGPGQQVHHPRAAREHALELGDRETDVDEREQGDAA